MREGKSERGLEVEPCIVRYSKPEGRKGNTEKQPLATLLCTGPVRLAGWQ